MIPLKKLSASSINSFDACELKWFLQYVLGYREPSGKAAVLGTICHYVLECIAKSKIARQDGVPFIEDEVVGRIGHDYDLEEWVDLCFEHFAEAEKHLVLTDSDCEQCHKNIEKARRHHLFPENHAHIIEPEGGFFLPIEEVWANYSYMEGDGVVNGKIQLNGFIDLVFRDERGTLNFVDYKFGSSTKDWATDKEKDTASIIRDTQLCMYYWALRKKFPDEDIVANLWFVKVGKTFTHIFDKQQEKHLMDKVESTIAKIRGLQRPNARYTWKCKFCPFKTTDFSSWGRPDLNVAHHKMPDARFDAVNGNACVCDTTKVFVDYRGLDATIQNGRAKIE